MNEFDAMNEVPVPDQWDDIVERAEAVDLLDLRPDTTRGRFGRVVPAVGVAAAILAAAIAAGIALHDDDHSEVASIDASRRAGLPELVCSGGELVGGSLPDESVPHDDPLYTIEVVRGLQPGTIAWAWNVGDLQVQLNVPSIPWADEGFPSEPVVEPRGRLLYQPASSSFIGPTGLPVASGCGTYEVMVGGGTDEEEAALALQVARGLVWEPIDVFSRAGLTDEATARAWMMGSVGGMVRDPGALESAVTTMAYDERLQEALDPGFQVDPSTAVLVSVVRRADGNSFVGINANPATFPDAPYIVSVLTKERLGSTLYSGFATADTADEIFGGPIDEADLRWIPSLTSSPPSSTG